MHHDGIRTWRHGRPGKDTRRLAGAELALPSWPAVIRCATPQLAPPGRSARRRCVSRTHPWSCCQNRAHRSRRPASRPVRDPASRPELGRFHLLDHARALEQVGLRLLHADHGATPAQRCWSRTYSTWLAPSSPNCRRASDQICRTPGKSRTGLRSWIVTPRICYRLRCFAPATLETHAS